MFGWYLACREARGWLLVTNLKNKVCCEGWAAAVNMDDRMLYTRRFRKLIDTPYRLKHMPEYRTHAHKHITHTHRKHVVLVMQFRLIELKQKLFKII